MKLVMLWDVDNKRPNMAAILNALPIIWEGVEKVLHHSDGDMSYDKFVNDVFRGGLILWLVFDKTGKYAGFITTRIDDNLNANRYCSLIHLYIHKDQDRDTFLDGFEEIKKFAKATGCHALRLWTTRNGWEKRLIPLGWKQSYVEYDLDIKDKKEGSV